jgi:hypothetical protein
MVAELMSSEDAITQLISEITTLWLHGRQRRIELGLKFIQLKDSVPYGQFITTVGLVVRRERRLNLRSSVRDLSSELVAN